MDKYIKLKDVLIKLGIAYDMARIDQKAAISNLQYEVNLIKAADVQPVKHGRWSECYIDSHHYSGICSVCGRASIKSLTENLYEYCPKCGARMDGGEQK